MKPLTDDNVRDLTERARAIRESIIDMLLSAGSGHTAGPLGMADIFALMYFHVLRHKPKDPLWSARDRVILSNGHICPVLYATMAHAGYFPVQELTTLRAFGSRLQGHPHREWLPGIETSSGPLGSGLSQAIGMALAERMDRGRASDTYFYVFMGDGELDAGQVWEAVMLAGKERLANILVIIDRNNIQIDGYTWDVMPLEPLYEKWESFNWQVQEVDGHNFEAMNDAIGKAQSAYGMPSVIIAHTIPGKGVDGFEKDYTWHGKPPNKEEATRALEELRTLGGKIAED
ncbi:MAG: transketolase [Candidatus Yonathbacteria bacterium]|nr:transketolase [Candidatus Yonathbacteria bacterium]NTW47468.1 transketolase [Candidatus Yonathbacteria bacterium]